jgi:signal transduction histidine kinase
LGGPSDSAEGDVGRRATASDAGRYEPVEHRAEEELRAVLAISRTFAGKLDLQLVLAAALEKVAELVGAGGASILLIDPDSGAMSFHVAAGPGARAAKSVPLPPGEGICGQVARSGRPLIVNNAQQDERLYRRVDQTTGITTRNLLCVPLRGSQRLWGVLELINKHHAADFDEHDLRLTEAIATQVAMALENAHLHGEIVRQERMSAIGRTVSGLAHCIKNILNGIRSGSAVVDRAMRGDDFGRVREGWNVVRQNNEMLGTLVLDMLSLARDSKFHPFPTDVNDLAEQICRLMAERASERGLKISCIPAADLPEVMTDPTLLYRCLLNIVTNAMDACEEGGSVRVRVYRAPRRGRVTLSVTDDGGGIAPEHRAKMFQDFFTTKGGRGTGLGLPVTRKLITKMGGSVTFHSVVGCGTRFVFALPVGGAAEEVKETD